MNCSGIFFIAKELLDVKPNVSNKSVSFPYHVGNILRYGGIEPPFEYRVILLLVGISWFWCKVVISGINVVDSIVSFTVSGEEFTSYVIVASLEIKNKGNMRLDVGDTKTFVCGSGGC